MPLNECAVACPACGSSDTRLAHRRLGIRRCGACSHAFTILPKDRQEAYGQEYFREVHKNWFENPNFGLFDRVLDEAVRRPGDRPLRILDVGCGQGDFLRHAARRRPDAHLVGIDLVDNEHPGIRFIRGDIFEAEIGERFDVIVNFAVIEHVDDPGAYVTRLGELLDPDGLLFTMTINDGSLVYRVGRALDRIGIHVVHDRLYSHHHLQHYTNRSLRALLESRGFEVVSHRNHNYPLAAVDVPDCGPVLRAVFRAGVAAAFLVSGPIGLGISQTVVCRKRS
jgi:2-polyprenyl-3-methyl-5-hydroxy-6-metoxy-1,4-benzoquinol methylase